MGNEHLDTVPATELDEIIKSIVENLVPIPSESEGVPNNMCGVPFHDNSPPLDVSKDQFEDFSDSNDESTSYDDNSFSIDNIEYVEASPPDSELVSSESSFTSLKSLLEETNTFDNSLPELETFFFDLEEISSGSTTTRSDISLPEYEAFYDNHVKEFSSGSTSTHSDSSLYDSFIFDLSINPFPPADRSDFYEFVDELTHIISPPEYDCFCFKNEPNSGDFTRDVVEDIFPTREPRVHNVLPTHPTHRTDFASWQQRIRLYCRGKENGVNILKSIDEEPYKMRAVREPLLRAQKKHLRLPKDIYTLINHYTDAKDIWDDVKMLLEGSELTKEDRELQLYDDFEHFRQHKGESIHDYYGRPNRSQGMNPRGGNAAGYGGAHNRDGNVNQGQARPCQARTMKCYNCNDVDEAPIAQTMFMANLSSAVLVTDEAGPSYDSDILSEVQDHNQYMDDVFAHHEEHVIHDSVQLDHVVDLHADYMSDSNMIPYDQYVMNNEVPVVHNNVSFVPNDAFMMIYNDMCEPPAQSVCNPSRNTVVKNSLTAELATYKEHVELYEQRAKFELTEREQKINEQLSRVISDRKFKEETLKRELHSIKLQLASTINHIKSMPALYNGHEIIKDNHTPTIVHNAEDTLEIAEITRKKMNDKINDPECVTRKVKIAPHDYSKENFLATFTP
nr:hypothetical protein [Tanacetum cinerariifolium]